MSCLERFRVPLPAPVLTHRLACLALMLLTGAAAGALAKWADFSSVQLLGDVFSELPIWILLGLVIARCSGSPGRAAAYAFVFFLAMIPAYYLAAEWMGGVWGITYVYGWARGGLPVPLCGLCCLVCLRPGVAAQLTVGAGRGGGTAV